MPNNECADKILEKVTDIQEKLNDTHTKVCLMEQHQAQMNGTLIKHDKMLCGDPERMGEGGLIHKQSLHDRKFEVIETQVKGLGKSVDKVRSSFALIWTGILTGVNILISYFKSQ